MNDCYPFENTPLNYSFEAMEPYIDSKTMYLHHDKHLQGYINNLNSVLKDYPKLQNYSLHQLISNPNMLPAKSRTKILNYAGGVFNHRLYFDLLANTAKQEPTGELLTAIQNPFESFENFKSEFTKSALSVFGSGYAWLVVSRDCRLNIVTTPNQNSPCSVGLYPILTIDVWEHAYYLLNYNDRAKYIENWFNIINWSAVELLYFKHKVNKR